MIKLLIGGSPCTYWSIAQTKNRETEAEGIGWELFRNYLIARDKFYPDYFLYENNKSMPKVIRKHITKELGVEPIMIDSALVSAQSRQRLYWTNIPGVQMPEDRKILLRDVLENGTCWREKSYTLRASDINRHGQADMERHIETNGRFGGQCVYKPIRVATFPKQNDGSAEMQKNDGAAYRVYSSDAKAVTIKSAAGGVGAVTGLYAIPMGAAMRGREDGANFETRDDGKANAITASGHQSRMVIESQEDKSRKESTYQVQHGKISIKGKQYPTKLPDGLYAIRKLSVTECKRIQTVPEWYEFPVSDTQAYKMLGNGWTVDVIAHILSYIPEIRKDELVVLSMYDGMGCGHIALDKLGGHIAKYYSMEIDESAVLTTVYNFPDVIQLGDAFQIRAKDWHIPEPEELLWWPIPSGDVQLKLF